MSFSIDSDFWLFQSGPKSRALADAAADEERGREFARSLFGLSQDDLASDRTMPAVQLLSEAGASLLLQGLPDMATPGISSRSQDISGDIIADASGSLMTETLLRTDKAASGPELPGIAVGLPLRMTDELATLDAATTRPDRNAAANALTVTTAGEISAIRAMVPNQAPSGPIMTDGPVPGAFPSGHQSPLSPVIEPSDRAATGNTPAGQPAGPIPVQGVSGSIYETTEPGGKVMGDVTGTGLLQGKESDRAVSTPMQGISGQTEPLAPPIRPEQQDTITRAPPDDTRLPADGAEGKGTRERLEIAIAPAPSTRPAPAQTAETDIAMVDPASPAQQPARSAGPARVADHIPASAPEAQPTSMVPAAQDRPLPQTIRTLAPETETPLVENAQAALPGVGAKPAPTGEAEAAVRQGLLPANPDRGAGISDNPAQGTEQNLASPVSAPSDIKVNQQGQILTSPATVMRAGSDRPIAEQPGRPSRAQIEQLNIADELPPAEQIPHAERILAGDGFPIPSGEFSGSASYFDLGRSEPALLSSPSIGTVQAPGMPAASVSPAGLIGAPAHAIMVATTSELPQVLASAARDGEDDRVVIQLDPPELGRVSLDFKFDPNGLQHVTITAETPEAMRQLRQMHFELVQALERNGLSAENMSFQQQNSQNNDGWRDQSIAARGEYGVNARPEAATSVSAQKMTGRVVATDGRLNIKL